MKKKRCSIKKGTPIEAGTQKTNAPQGRKGGGGGVHHLWGRGEGAPVTPVKHQKGAGRGNESYPSIGNSRWSTGACKQTVLCKKKRGAPRRVRGLLVRVGESGGRGNNKSWRLPPEWKPHNRNKRTTGDCDVLPKKPSFDYSRKRVPLAFLGSSTKTEVLINHGHGRC